MTLLELLTLIGLAFSIAKGFYDIMNDNKKK